jgi:hypothetical protein
MGHELIRCVRTAAIAAAAGLWLAAALPWALWESKPAIDTRLSAAQRLLRLR